MLTGAQAIAHILRQHDTRMVFAYIGTSELCLAESLITDAGVNLINARGDKEAVFMAGGAALAGAQAPVALLHGARGLTNATGAVGDARRNEVGLLCIVGMPATRSAPFLPPHGEHGLIDAVGAFAVGATEIGPDRSAFAACHFIEALRQALARVRTRPFGPVLFGIPQDASEEHWVPETAVEAAGILPPAPAPRTPGALERAIAMIDRSSRPLILLDDYFLRQHGARGILREFCRQTGAAVAQVRYRRGPMLFEQLRAADLQQFAGLWPPTPREATRLSDDVDLLITLEDRNFYRRVVGELPKCPKLAISSAPHLTRKNRYLNEDDLLIAGDVAEVLVEICRSFGRDGRAASWMGAKDRPAPEAGPRHDIARAVGDALRAVPSPVLVDDSQLFGGLIADAYEHLPLGVRVFGPHGGFVGSGIGYAVGHAFANPSSPVLCLLGDSAFTNGMQGIIVAAENGLAITFLVANNGGSVSLRTQATSSRFSRMAQGSHLSNPHLSYAAVATALGLRAETIRLDGTATSHPRALLLLMERLSDDLAEGRPALIEILLPDDPGFWSGIWCAHGLDE